MISHSKPLRFSRPIFFFSAIILAWVAVWLVKLQLGHITWLNSSGGSFLFWTIAKIFVWILPAYWLIVRSGRTLEQVFNIAAYRQWLVWGAGSGLLIALTGWLPKILVGTNLLPAEFSFALLNILFIAPLFEEFLVRGALLGVLQESLSFASANVVSSLMFIALHLPGWFFTGNLMEMLIRPIGGALSIFVVSLIFGFVTNRSDSLLAGIISHFLNNLASV